MEIGWTEEKVTRMDELALEDHRYQATRVDLERYRQH